MYDGRLCFSIWRTVIRDGYQHYNDGMYELAGAIPLIDLMHHELPHSRYADGGVHHKAAVTHFSKDSGSTHPTATR